MTTKLLVPFIVAVVAISGILLSTGSMGAAPQASSLSASPMFLGHLEAVAKDVNGNIKAYRQTDNLVVNTGKTCAGVLIFGIPTNSTQSTACAGATAFKQIAVGTATAAVAAGDTTLGIQIGSRATNGTYSLLNGTAGALGASAANPVYSIQTTFRPNANIAEAGIFDTASGNPSHMFAHQTFTAISLASTDTLTVTWRVSLN